jgi:ADP-ribose pyrophosphatase YjhB (NUDIX family)
MHDVLHASGAPHVCPVLFLVKDNAVLLGHRHYRKETWKNVSVWTCPGGRSTSTETIEEALRREVAEEVGITDVLITHLLGTVPGAKEGDEVPVFIGTTTSEAVLQEPEKFSEWRWFSREACVRGECEPFINPRALKLFLAHTTDI